MAWHLPGDKPLSEAMLPCFTDTINITWPLWVNRWLDISWPTCGVCILRTMAILTYAVIYLYCICFFCAIHFYPRPVLAFGYCRCLRLSVCPSVRVCGNHLLVRAITRHPFKLGSPNLDHRCKRPWLRSLLFWGVIDLDLQGQIKLQSQKLPHFELLGTITHHLFKLGSPNLGKRCKIPGLRLLLTLGLIGLDLQFHFQFWNPFS